MRTDRAAFRRLAAAIALSGATAIGAVALAPAAVADDTAAISAAPVMQSAVVVEPAPVTDDVARGLDALAALRGRQAQELIEMASEKKCLDAPVSGGRV